MKILYILAGTAVLIGLYETVVYLSSNRYVDTYEEARRDRIRLLQQQGGQPPHELEY